MTPTDRSSSPIRERSINGNNPPNAHKKEQGWVGRSLKCLGKACSDLFALDRLGKIALSASVALGASIAASANSSRDTMDGLALASLGASLSCMLWGLGSALKGEKTTAIKCLGAATLFGGYGYNVTNISRGVTSSSLSTFSSADHQLAFAATPYLFPAAAAAVPLDVPATPSERVKSIESEGAILKDRVLQALRHGGIILPFSKGNKNAVYIVMNKKGKIIAIFKPDDERQYGPNYADKTRRRPDASEEDIYFHQMSSFEQGRTDIRQHLAMLLDFQELIPVGIPTELSSNRFSYLHMPNPGIVITKTGYLQEWVESAGTLASLHPEAQKKENKAVGFIPEEAYSFKNNPILENVPLDEFQMISILDLITFNEDRHPGNLLVQYDEDGIPHLVPIDNDSILPWKLNKNDAVGLTSHQRADEPFTASALEAIAALNPENVEQIVRSQGLPDQSAINARIMVTVLQHFAVQGKTLGDIHRFISRSPGVLDLDHLDHNVDSTLWKMVKASQENAIDHLYESDRAAYKHKEHLRWKAWQRKPFSSEEFTWQNDYNANNAQRIEKQLLRGFWRQFKSKLKKYTV